MTVTPDTHGIHLGTHLSRPAGAGLSVGADSLEELRFQRRVELRCPDLDGLGRQIFGFGVRVPSGPLIVAVQ